jgi:hypothetical protein
MGFLNKAFRKVKKQIQPGQMPRRGGGFGNLGEAIRRMQEQGGMGDAKNADLPIGPGGTTNMKVRSFSARASTDGQHA